MSVRLTERPLSSTLALKELGAPGVGGIVLFVGRVRSDRIRAGTVRALAYESHRALALKAFRSWESEARRRFGVRRIVIWHRVGLVRAGAPSVIVGAAGAHRRSAFDAASMLIERLKADAPLWKSARVRSGRPPRRPLGRASAR